ncbi:MAG: type III secretion system export apparatus subunit SctR [Sandaracinaceae bacterium]|nr:type III secretion system export apparatus subunit SctR [Sandaracinaceae bacterium]MDW8247641.1 type III secretion system export apparatus subunit SctR [Sandaracinaceae bacterium]
MSEPWVQPHSIPLLLVLALLALLPFAFMTLTSFVKFSIVFSILRNALGAGQVPSGMVISALSMVLSVLVMFPVGERVIQAIDPIIQRIDYRNPRSSTEGIFEAIQKGIEPLRTFWERNSSTRERSICLSLAKKAQTSPDSSISEKDLSVIVPAFILTELREAFEIGVLIYIPFLVIDLVITNLLLALGIQTLSPTQISIPFKLLLFTMVDGWALLSSSLVLGYSH